MKIAYQKYPLVGNYTHPWVLLTIIINMPHTDSYNFIF